MLLLAGLLGCGFDKVETPVADLAGADLLGGAPDLSGGAPDLSAGPATNCRTLPLPCLDLASVIEVPTEATLSDAFAQAQIGDIVQVKGLSLGAGFRVPMGVTLRGCSGAQITDTIAFEGGLGTIEGFTVPGAIIANRTGTFVIRANRFVDGGSTTFAGVSARANEGIVSAAVTATVEGNWFIGRDYGVQGLTAYDTMTHSVDLTVRNNVFYGLAKAGVTLDEAGLVGQIKALIAFNSFVGCGHGVELTSVQATTRLVADIFYTGGYAVVSDSPYSLANVDAYGVLMTMGAQPLSGSFANLDPMFADWGNSDLHLLPGSPLVDAVANGPDVPADDYFGCPRPVAGGADVGAIENQQ